MESGRQGSPWITLLCAALLSPALLRTARCAPITHPIALRSEANERVRATEVVSWLLVADVDTVSVLLLPATDPVPLMSDPAYTVVSSDG